MKLCSTVGAMGCLILLVVLCLSCGDSTEQATPAAGEAPGADSAGAAVDEAVDEAVDAAEEAVEDAAATIDQINAELAEKESELERITEEIKGLSPTDMAGEKGKELQKKSEALSDEIQKLKDKLDSFME